jgi:hypothetical protein
VININKKYMTTTAIGFIILSSFLLFTQNVEQIKHEDKKIIQEEIPEVKIETKTEIKTKNPIIVEKTIVKQEEIKNNNISLYTKNLSDKNIENASYLIREDNWIPYYIEPIDENNIYSPAFYGEIADEYNIEFDNIITNIENLKIDLENFLGFNIKTIKASGTSGVFIKINQQLTAKEVEYIKTNISKFKNVIWSDINSGILPEYQTEYYKKIINNSLIPEQESF